MAEKLAPLFSLAHFFNIFNHIIEMTKHTFPEPCDFGVELVITNDR